MMPDAANLCLIFLIFKCGESPLKGVAAVVQTQQTVTATVGEDAPLSCQLLETKDVHQVTWQKVFGSKERHICSYSEYFGQTMNPDFKDKVHFTEAGLKNSSIVIKNVTEEDEGCYLCLFSIYPDGALKVRTCLNVYGAAAVVKTQQTVSAAVGEDAPLSCQLLGTKGVQQVTWQKDFGNKERNICSYSEYFGQTVNPDFKDKVQFTEAGLKNSSIVIRKVTEQDEGCYFCLFHIYPDVALIGRTCLKAYELHEPILDVSRSKSPAESVVSCSATGGPAPTVTLTVLQQNLSFSHYNSSSVTHSNGTVTVTTTALLSAFSSTQVGCSVSVLSAAPREKMITVPGVKGTSDDVLEKQSKSSLRDSRWPLTLPLLMMAIIGIFFS